MKDIFFRFERVITSSRFLIRSGIAYIFLSMSFILVMQIWDFFVIDEMYEKEAILNHIKNLSDTQRQVHSIMTATLDVAYPLIYGPFQAGMALRYLGVWGKPIALLSLFCVPVDLIEGFSQVMLLNGSIDYIDLKTLVTPIKLGLFLPGFTFAIIALVIALMRARRDRR